MMLAFLMYLMMQKQADSPLPPEIIAIYAHKAGACTPKILRGFDSSCTIGQMIAMQKKPEPREYPAILHEVDETPACRFYLDDNHCRGVKRSTKKTYTCSSPDTEILEYTVSGRAFCRKVTP